MADGTRPERGIMNVEPNPYSPYATADPAQRHLFPTLFGPPASGILIPAGCHRLAVVPDHPTELDPDTTELPDGLCPGCVDSLRGLPATTAPRPVTACRTCGQDTHHNQLCALCRAEAHDLWQHIRTTDAPSPPTVPFVALGGPISVTPHAFCEHGDLAFALRLNGYHLTGDQHEGHLDVVFPRCYLAKILGAALAVVDHDSNPEAHDRFTTTVNRTQDRVATALRHRDTSHDQDGTSS